MFQKADFVSLINSEQEEYLKIAPLKLTKIYGLKIVVRIDT